MPTTTLAGPLTAIHWTKGSGIVALTVGDQAVYADAGPFFRAARDAGLTVGQQITVTLDDAGWVVTSFQIGG